MTLRPDDIIEIISKIDFVKQICFLKQDNGILIFKTKIDFKELNEVLDFEVDILSFYPFKSYDADGIKFRNKELIDCGHVMGDGSICIHTSHSVKLKEKLIIDFNALKNWIVKYYINKDSDANYEHIIVPQSPFNDCFQTYIFTNIENEFKKGEYGFVDITFMNKGQFKGKPNYSFLVQSFYSKNGKKFYCKWSDYYKVDEIQSMGIYLFLESVPAVHNRFIFKNWSEFQSLIPQSFLEFLYNFQKGETKKAKGKNVAFFIGYNTVESEIHWQVAILKIGNFPLVGIPQKINNKKTGKWTTTLIDEKITWAFTRNSSYKYFFGRGALSSKITEKNILIIGVGAVGSMVANILTRGGCKYIDIVDFDIKEPENVCRSEYTFFNGVLDKTAELKKNLCNISPFVNVGIYNHNLFENYIKTIYDYEKPKDELTNYLDNYDLIFDCTTDNDLMYVLNKFEIKGDLINMSITNHAKELVCAFHPNIYNFVVNQFENVLKNDVEDLYNPTGCWSPTFKASYNDINVLVQFAIKHINILFVKEKQKNNFVIQSDRDDLNLKIVEH